MNGLVKRHNDLDVFKKSFAISLVVHKATLEFPKIEQYGLGDQMRRASKGICANIAEGFAKQQASKPEFKRFLLIAIGSATEMQVWVEYAFSLEHIDREQMDSWSQEYSAITRMLQSLYNNA